MARVAARGRAVPGRAESPETSVLTACECWLHELPEPDLVTAVQEAEMIAMPTQITRSKSCVHTHAPAGEGGVSGAGVRAAIGPW